MDSHNSHPTRSIQVVLQPASQHQQLEIVANRAGLISRPAFGFHLGTDWLWNLKQVM